MDIVEIDGRAVAKRGKWSGAKQVLRCAACGCRRIVPLEESEGRTSCPRCGASAEPLLVPLVEEGELVRPHPRVDEIRSRALEELAAVEETGEETRE